MKDAPNCAAVFGFFPFVLGVFLIAPLVSGAAILYGPDAHKKEYTVTSTLLAGTSSDGWDRLGKNTLGIFLSVAQDGEADLLSPEILLLPCIKGRPCVSLSLEEPPAITKAFSFLRTANTLAVDLESAAALETTAESLCSLGGQSGAQGSYRTLIDVVTEDSVLHKEFTGTGCDLAYPKKRSDSFLSRIFAYGISNN